MPGMTQFEYLSVLVSIVLALGISENLLCWVRLIQHRNTVRFSWLHGFWSVFVLILMMQFWWGFWNYRQVPDWSFLNLLNIVLEAMLVVVIAGLLTPGRQFAPDIDLEDLYFDNAKPLFLVATAMLVSLCIADTTLLQDSIFTTENLIRALGILLTLTLAFNGKKKVHYAMAIVAGLLLFLFQVYAVFT